eukprot:NODE_10199_length_1369_cov_9.669887.p1 GENE.NODE_10199_length_1369_cov_9.669887~~NODE_10199_length_1369_cov_9.669887.p1  ORF type:complete len:314 (-),score=27.39 NODE_10199_length_1369_cov_9.669887:330-1271(-)
MARMTALPTAFTPYANSSPEEQHEWHDTYGDMKMNMYRTSYQDMVQGHEVAVKNDFPAGYGGHVPSVRHDVMFRNSLFDRMQGHLRAHPDRDTFPTFVDQKDGQPCHTAKPRGARMRPTPWVVPNLPVKTPWANTLPLQQQPSFHTTPRWSRSFSSPAPYERTNTSAILAGAGVAGSSASSESPSGLRGAIARSAPYGLLAPGVEDPDFETRSEASRASSFHNGTSSVGFERGQVGFEEYGPGSLEQNYNEAGMVGNTGALGGGSGLCRPGLENSRYSAAVGPDVPASRHSLNSWAPDAATQFRPLDTVDEWA